MHPLVKRPLEKAISSPAVGWMTQRRVRGKRLILAYHGIIPEGERPAGERALFVKERDFCMQLDMIAAEADVAPLDRIDDPGNGRPRVAITFDDAYAGAVNVGVRELTKRNLPATIFVVPARLNGHIFWWDALSDDSSVLDPWLRDFALRELGGREDRVRAWAATSSLPTSHGLPAHARAATRSELHAAVASPGITVGSHTWSHPNLATLSDADLVAEVKGSREWLRSEFGGKAIDWLAYPYGIDSGNVRRAVQAASYTGAVRIDGGWHLPNEVSPFARPRFSIGSGLSIEGLRARLNGVMLS